MDLKQALDSTYGYLDVPLFEIAGTRITVATLVTLVLILIATFVISRVLQSAVARGLRAGRVTAEGTLGVARQLVHYTVLIIGLCVGLQTVGINLSALFAAGAIFAVAVGFAMQNIMQNFVAGVILLVERAIKPGDVLYVDGRVVRVAQMGMRATIVRSRDEEDLILPNSLLVQSSVANYTLRDSIYRVRASVGVVYGSDMALVRGVLERTAVELSWREADRPPVILMRAFGSSSVDFEVSVWVQDPWKAPQRLSELHEAIWWALKSAGVTIAFPQLDVHFDPPVVESLESLGRTA
jgi:small-conductance mechanosensitive channel